MLVAALLVALSIVSVAGASSVSDPQPLSDCFGHKGVQFASNDAYMCEVKMSDNSAGALYYMVSLDNGLNGVNPGGQMVWYKLHPADGNYYMWENFSPAWGGSGQTDGRVIGIDEGPKGQCIVNFPSWSTPPSQCAYSLAGGTLGTEHTLDATEQASVNSFVTVMTAEIPAADR